MGPSRVMRSLGPSKNMGFQAGKGPSKNMRFLGPTKNIRFQKGKHKNGSIKAHEVLGPKISLSRGVGVQERPKYNVKMVYCIVIE